MEGWQAACARREAGHGHGDCPRRASQRAAEGGVIRQSFLAGPESGVGSATSPLAEFFAQRGFRVVEALWETSSGWNGRRKARLRIFRNPEVQVIVVEQGDRLMRFGLQ